MAEYSEQSISLYGVTGTPEELLRMCPVRHENMTVEAKNMFLVMAMNESEVPIKEEHMPYFREVTESRGVELKVTVQEIASTPPVPPKLVQAPRQHNETFSDRIAVTVTANKDLLRSKTAAKEAILPQPNVIVVVSEQPSTDAGIEVYVDESTTGQMNEWLTQLRSEFETRSHDLDAMSLFDHSETTPGEVPGVASLQTASKIPAKEPPRPQIKNNPMNPSLLVKRTYDFLTQDDTLLQDLKAEHEPSLMDTAEKEVGQFVLAEGLGPTDVYYPVGSIESDEVWISAEYEALLNGVTHENRQPVLGVNGVSTNSEQQRKDLLTFAELMPTVQEELSEMQPEYLIDRITSYVRHDDTITESVARESTVLITEINALTDELVLLSTKPEFVSPENKEQVEERLHELCQELLEILGVESNDELLRKFILTIISEKSSVTNGMEIDEVVHDILHERKQFTLHSLAVGFQARLPNFLLLGRYALAT